MSGELSLKGVGKSYRTWSSEWLRMASWFGLPVKPKEQNWVLANIDFHVGKGETVGIIGQNGAGKSTLLKIVTGTVRPDRGEIVRNGRVAAILELGMGFNPDLTGRANVVHAAGIMGMEHSAIMAAMPGIESFAEIGDYFDQPVRTYSSGMQMRVAFSVATAFKPDLLIIDEALSVGDSYFQHKSFDRIRAFREQGTSILFVSHGLSDVKTLCDRVILLDKGTILKDGAPDEVVDYYNAMVAVKENQALSIEQRRAKDGWLLTRSGTREVTVESLGLFDAGTQEPIRVASVGQRVELKLRAKVNDAIPRLVLGYMLRDKQGHVIWGTNTWHTKQLLTHLEQDDLVEYSLAFTCTLGPGSYSVSPALVSSDTHVENNYEWIDNLFVFDVINTSHSVFIGATWLDAEFDIRHLNRSVEQS
ncbi:ABC transporter ATP-binding protein [Pseudoxanthomonas dokdonensis]|uniref:Sugar ABC transporter ATP-binding protein n=1 Tax=Pseudoxanthomonas dokdonensis TaxID=344882 RepID=A0A0R0CI73_9GAMM|nr:ABC transporter ATP-binding protein [Pseudoxanthomonas dokdonensis]KRG69613.1 sugar ABC transporter ATP-binding protein [Pseudoxanthomonas dokdonensis]